MKILETERLTLRELDKACDSAFVLELLNSPKFLQYIGDRNVRSVDEAADFIDNKYAASYREHGYGLYAVDLKKNGMPIGICGFVRRDTLPGPDLGFAFLPEFEGKGYGYESASEVLDYGRDHLGFTEVFAILSPRRCSRRAVSWQASAKRLKRSSTSCGISAKLRATS